MLKMLFFITAIISIVILTSCATRIPSIKGKIASETDIKMNDLYWQAYYTCKGRRLMIYTTTIENCGHRHHTINVNKHGKFKLPSAFFITFLSNPSAYCDYDLYYKNQKNKLFTATWFPDKKSSDVLLTIVKKNITVKFDTTVINKIIDIIEKHYNNINFSKLTIKFNYEIKPGHYSNEMEFGIEELLQKDSISFSEYIAMPHKYLYYNSNNIFQEKFTLEIYKFDNRHGKRILLELFKSRDFKLENYDKDVTFSLKDKKQAQSLITNIQNSFFASAVQQNNIEEVRKLLKKGADPNKKTNENIPVLIEATKDKNYELIKILLDAGADVNSSYENKSVIDHAIAKVIPENSPVYYLYRNRDGVEKYIAAIKKMGKIIELLLKNGAEIENDSSDIPNLIKAVYFNDYKLVKKLVEQGADVNSIYEGIRLAEISVLEQAITSPKILPELYIKGKKSKKYLDELEENNKIIKLLIKHGAKIEEDSRILWKCILMHTFNRIDFLAENGCIDIKKLLENKFSHSFIKEMSYLHIATDKEQEIAIPVIRYLLNKGMDVDIKNKKGQTPLLYTLTNRNFYRSKYILGERTGKNISKIIYKLIDNGADVKAKNKDKQTVLHALLDRKYEKALRINRIEAEEIDSADIKQRDDLLELVNYLIDLGIDINAVDDDGFIAFHYCAQGGHLNVAKLLLNKGIDINYPIQSTKVDTAGNKEYGLFYSNYTPLFITATKASMHDPENIRMFELLLKRGADINYKPEDGETLDDIINNNLEETIIVLKNILKKYSVD